MGLSSVNLCVPTISRSYILLQVSEELYPRRAEFDLQNKHSKPHVLMVPLGIDYMVDLVLY